MFESSPPSGIAIRTLDTLEAAQEAAALLVDVWGGGTEPLPAEMMRALEHAGSYVVGLYDGERMIGVSAAFFAAPAARSMHSHVTGVLDGYQGRGLGRLLKQHQREWALARDVGHITWTFDPLIARNAHFNLRVLGARATEYLVNQYGTMDDGLNRGDESDRLLASWALASPPVATPADDLVVATVPVPADIEALRRTDPSAARGWRLRVREQFEAALADGLVVGGFDDDRGYLMVAR